MAQEYEYGFLPQDERYLGLLGNLFSPMRRPIIEAPETTYLDADGALYPQYSEGVYGEPEFGLQYMPAYQAIAGLLSDPVETAKAMPEAMRQAANDQILAGLDIATGGTGELVTEEGRRISYDTTAIPATSAIAPALATARALPDETILGSGYGKIGHNRPPVVVGKTPYVVTNELRGTQFRTAELPDGSRVLLDASGQPYIEDKTINKLLTGTPITEMSSVFTPPPRGILVDPVEVSPEDFEGQWMVNASGDRTRYGNLSEVNGIPLYGRGTDLEGGDEFMQSQRAAWASAPTAISAMENQVEAIRGGLFGSEGKDAPINLTTTNMAERSGDFAVDTAETIMRMIPNMDIGKKDLKAFEKKIKEKYKDFPGLSDPDAALEWLNKDRYTKGAGNRRLFFAQTAAAGDFQKRGFPDIGSVRAAISRPETRFMPYGRTGAAISRLADEGELAVRRRLEEIDNPHKTYPDMIGKPDAYLGGYGVTLDRAMAFPDAYSTLLGRGSDQSGVRRVFDIGREAQFMTPELVDLQMRYIEEQKRLLRQYGLLNDVY